MADLTARDAIPAGQRYRGLTVYVLSNGMSQIEVIEIVNENTVVNFGGKTYYAKPLCTIDRDLSVLGI